MHAWVGTKIDRHMKAWMGAHVECGTRMCIRRPAYVMRIQFDNVLSSLYMSHASLPFITVLFLCSKMSPVDPSLTCHTLPCITACMHACMTHAQVHMDNYLE